MREISIIVPVYNALKQLDRCIGTVRIQTYREYECIMTDDGTPDKSGVMCDEYALADDRFISVHQCNRGVSAARNTGMALSSCRFIAFVDSDDYAEADYLSALYEGMTDGVGMSVCGVRYCNDINDSTSTQENRGDYITAVSDSEQLALLVSDRRLNYVYAKLFRADVIKSNALDFRIDISLGEDTIFVVDYLTHISDINVIGKPYYNYVKYYTHGTLSSAGTDNYDKLSYITSYIGNSLRNPASESAALDAALYERYICASVWSIDKAVKSKYALRKKYKLIKHIVTDEALRKSLVYSDCMSDYELYYGIKKGSASTVILQYKMNNVGMTLRKIAVKIFPKSIIRMVKKCLRIVP